MSSHHDEQELWMPHMEVEIFDVFRRTFNARLKLAFRDSFKMPKDLFKYKPHDKSLALDIEKFFSEKDVWNISLEEIDKAFGSEIVDVIYFLSWEAKKAFLPRMMELSLENYSNGHIIIECSDNILLSPHGSDDISDCFDDWILSFSDLQKSVVLDFIMIMRVDVRGAYRGAHFRNDPSMWIP